MYKWSAAFLTSEAAEKIGRNSVHPSGGGRSLFTGKLPLVKVASTPRQHFATPGGPSLFYFSLLLASSSTGLSFIYARLFLFQFPELSPFCVLPDTSPPHKVLPARLLSFSLRQTEMSHFLIRVKPKQHPPSMWGGGCWNEV